MIWQRPGWVLTEQMTEDSAKRTYKLLQATYWSHKRPLDVVERMLCNSMPFFLLREEQQVGFARVITDGVTTSWLADVVLEDQYQGQGVGTWMMQCIMDHPQVRDTQFVLQTGTAHEFYQRLGFSSNDALMSTRVDYLNG